MITPSIRCRRDYSEHGLTAFHVKEYFPVDSEATKHKPYAPACCCNGIGQDVFTVNHQPGTLSSTSMTSRSITRRGSCPQRGAKWLISTSWRKRTDALSPTAKSSVSHRSTREHCRHKIFGGQFIINSQEMESSLFNMIKKTTNENP